MHHPLNLRVLQRQDPTISAILESTSYAVLYDFSDDRWHKTGKEGTLFLYERASDAAGPSRGLFLLNRSSPDNFNHPILPSTELDMQGKVLMIEDAGPNDSNVVSGLWVSNGEEGQTLLNRLTEVRDSLRTSSGPDPLPASAVSVGSPGGASALSSLLSNLATSAAPAATSSSSAVSQLSQPPHASAPSAPSAITSSSSALAPATNSSLVAPATTTTTTMTTNGSLSFNEILTRLQSPAAQPAVPAFNAASQPHPPYPHSPPRQPSHLHQHQQQHQPLRNSPGSFHVGPPGSHPSQTPTSFYPYPPHQLHHQQQAAHASPVHIFSHNPAGGPLPGSPSGSPFVRHTMPQQQQLPSFGFAPHQPHPSSPFAQRSAPSGPGYPYASGPPPPFNLAPLQQPQQQQQQASPSRPTVGRTPDSFPSPSTAPLPRGTQLLDQMFNSLAPPPAQAH